MSILGRGSEQVNKLEQVSSGGHQMSVARRVGYIARGVGCVGRGGTYPCLNASWVMAHGDSP